MQHVVADFVDKQIAREDSVFRTRTDFARIAKRRRGAPLARRKRRAFGRSIGDAGMGAAADRRPR
jgi:hypothetical protein